MRNLTIIGSLLIHVLVFGYALRVSTRARARVATAVVVGEKKKPKTEEKPKPPKPKPAAPPKVEPQVAPQPLKNAPSKAPEVAPAPVETGLTMDSADAPGIDLGGRGPQQPKGPAQGTKPEERITKKDKVLTGGKNAPEEDNCTEAPSKPQPETRPTDIEYTQDARANGVEGRLVLKIIVAADGSVSDVQVVSSVEAALDAAAIAAVKTWTFKPSMRCGKPMGGGVFTLARRFELGD